MIHIYVCILLLVVFGQGGGLSRERIYLYNIPTPYHEMLLVRICCSTLVGAVLGSAGRRCFKPGIREYNMASLLVIKGF